MVLSFTVWKEMGLLCVPRQGIQRPWFKWGCLLLCCDSCCSNTLDYYPQLHFQVLKQLSNMLKSLFLPKFCLIFDFEFVITTIHVPGRWILFTQTPYKRTTCKQHCNNDWQRLYMIIQQLDKDSTIYLQV